MTRGYRSQPVKESALIQPRRNRICLFEDQDKKWFWDEWELIDLCQMWNQELHIYYMADYFNVKPSEIMLALLHLEGEDNLAERHFSLLSGIQGPYVKAEKLKYAKFAR